MFDGVSRPKTEPPASRASQGASWKISRMEFSSISLE